MKTYKYRIYPTAKQATILRYQLGICRWVYNTMLATKRDAWDNMAKSLSKYDLINMLPTLKEEHVPWKEVHSQVVQEVVVRVSKAFDNFFRRVKDGEKPGYPRFKSYGQYRSITFPQYGNGVNLEPTSRKDAYLTASKVGRLYVKYHRPIQGDIKTVNLSCNRLGEWFVSFACDNVPAVVAPHPQADEVGIDVGLKTFAVFSDSAVIDNPRFFRKGEANLATVQRKLSATYERSGPQRAKNKANRTTRYTPELNRRKRAVQKVHKRIANQRANFVHQHTKGIVAFYGAIYVEELDIQQMVDNGRYNKSIYDAAWGLFRQVLAYKAASAGRRFRAVDPRGTTQRCSQCGVTVPKTIEIRRHDCHNCGLSIDRDLNAARNICALGWQCLEAQVL